MTYEGFRNIARQYDDVVETRAESGADGEFYLARLANGYAVRYSDRDGSSIVAYDAPDAPLNEGRELTIEEAFREAGAIEG